MSDEGNCWLYFRFLFFKFTILQLLKNYVYFSNIAGHKIRHCRIQLYYVRRKGYSFFNIAVYSKFSYSIAGK